MKYIGSQAVSKKYVGAAPVSRKYVGSQLVWEAPGSGTPSPLLTDLIEWYEGGGLVGLHAANTITPNDPVNYHTEAGPFVGSTAHFGATVAHDGAREDLYLTYDAILPYTGDFTWAAVLYLDTARQFARYEIQDTQNTGGGNIAGRLSTNSGDGQLVPNRWRSSNFNNGTSGVLPYDQWFSLVGSHDVTAETLVWYVNGAVVRTYTGRGDNSGIWKFRQYSFNSKNGVFQNVFASRAWSQDDVNEFHNTGNFVRYQDLLN